MFTVWLLAITLSVTLFVQTYKFVRDILELKERKRAREKLYNLLCDIDYFLDDKIYFDEVHNENPEN